MSIDRVGKDGFMISGAQDINLYRLVTLRASLKLELKGLRFSGRSTYAIVKKEFGLKGNRASVYMQFDKIVEAAIKERNA